MIVETNITETLQQKVDSDLFNDEIGQLHSNIFMLDTTGATLQNRAKHKRPIPKKTTQQQGGGMTKEDKQKLDNLGISME